MPTFPYIRRYITAISTGRCATFYTMRVFMHTTDCLAEHEALPRPQAVLQRMNMGHAYEEYGRLFCAMKAHDIHYGWNYIKPGRPRIDGKRFTAYVDTSNVFCKCITHPRFPALFDALGATPDGERSFRIIHLRRDRRECAQSLLSAGMYAGPSELATLCTMFPDHPFMKRRPGAGLIIRQSLGKPEAEQTLVARAALSLWHISSVERIADEAVATWGPEVVQSFDIDELNTLEGCRRLANHCGVTLDEEALAQGVLGKPQNTLEQQRVPRQTLTDEQWERAVSNHDKLLN